MYIVPELIRGRKERIRMQQWLHPDRGVLLGQLLFSVRV